MITIAHRRARLARRGMLDRPIDEPRSIADRLVGLHSSDPATVVLSLHARRPASTIAEIDDVLYGRDALLRIHAMRRTLFVVGHDLARVMNTAATRDLIAPERKRLVGMIEQAGLADDGDAWIDRLAADIEASLAARGVASARELTLDVPDLARQMAYGEGKSWAGTVGVSTRMLYLLAIQGRIARARPNGGWTSGQYTWRLLDEVVPGGLAPIDADEARADLVHRYLAAYGPATAVDVKWWTGWPLGVARRALATTEAVEVDVETGSGSVTTGWALADDADPGGPDDDEPEPWVALLPSLDSTAMGWKEREWYVGPHSDRLFDRNGNAGPTIWVDGRMVGAWACADGGEIRVGILDDIGRERTADIEAEAARLSDWLDGARVTPRFRSPLDIELVPRTGR